MKRTYKIIIIVCVFLVAMTLLSMPAFALTEKEVKTKVAETSKEAVSGNVFIWFLCAIAFLKVSQKIDSFMSSLGINVGHTGGNMLAEALVAARGISMGKQILGGGGGPGKFSGGTSDGSKFLSGGLAGAVSRKFNNSAVSSATKQGGNVVTRNAFQSSMAKGGGFANNIIGSVAKGDIKQMGSITGDTANKALTSYMGYAEKGTVPPHSDIDVGHSQTSEGGANNSIPTYSDVEIGGGRILGNEATPENPDGIQFGMYNTEQYLAPEKGSYETVETADGAKWYKQYAMDTVEKTPYTDDHGKIAYNEAIVQKLPPLPRRKDRV